MKKSLIAASLFAMATSVSAADLTVLGGHDNAGHRDFVGASVGTTVAGLAVTGDVTYAHNFYSTFGATVGKNVNVGGLTFTPFAGVTKVDRWNNTDGWVGAVGLSAAYPLTKKVAAVVTGIHNMDIQEHSNLRGNTVSAGLKYTF